MKGKTPHIDTCCAPVSKGGGCNDGGGPFTHIFFKLLK